MTEKFTALEIDGQTGQELIRDLTAEEIAEKQELALQSQQEQDLRNLTKESALAKLAALGLTEEEIAAL
jgi:hypothetical protein